MQSPPFPRYLVPPRSKYSPQHHVLKHPQLPFLPQCEQYKPFSSSLCNLLHSPVTSSLLGPNILLNTMLSNTLGFLSSHNVNDQVSHPYKTTGKIIVLYEIINSLKMCYLQNDVSKFCCARCEYVEKYTKLSH